MSRKGYRGYEKDDYDDGYDYYDDDYPPADDKKGGEKEASTTLEILVDKHHHKVLIGPAGATVRGLNQSYHVEVTIPRRDDPDSYVYVYGLLSDARKCKDRILEMIGQKTVESAGRTRGGVLATTAENAAAFPVLPSQAETVIELNLSKASHGNFIGTSHERKDELLRNLRGAKRVPGIDITIPKREDVSNVISIHVPLSHVEDSKRIIQAFLERYDLVGATNRSEMKVVTLGAGALPLHKAAVPAAVGKPPVAPPAAFQPTMSTTPKPTSTVGSKQKIFLIPETYFDVASLRFPGTGQVITDPGVSEYSHEVRPKCTA